jgi:hypothetical protein
VYETDLPPPYSEPGRSLARPDPLPLPPPHLAAPRLKSCTDGVVLLVVTSARSSSKSSGSSAVPFPFSLTALAPDLCGSGSGGVEADGHAASSTPGHGVAHGPAAACCIFDESGRARSLTAAVSASLRQRSSNVVDDGEVQQQDGGEAQRGGDPRPP